MQLIALRKKRNSFVSMLLLVSVICLCIAILLQLSRIERCVCVCVCVCVRMCVCRRILLLCTVLLRYLQSVQSSECFLEPLCFFFGGGGGVGVLGCFSVPATCSCVQATVILRQLHMMAH